MRSSIPIASLKNIFQNYRIVAMGVRLKTNVDFTKSGGRVYGAILPASAELPQAFSNGTTAANALDCFEIPNDGGNVSTNIINLPRGFQFTVSELMSEGGCEVIFPICSARALDFLDAQPQDKEQHLTYTNATGVEVANTGLGIYQAAGFSQFVLRAEGLNASADVFSCEVIYHVEGVPVVGSSALVESMPHTPAPSSPHEVHAAHAMAALQPVVKYVSQKMREAAATKKTRPWARAAAVGGAAERILGIAVRGMTVA